jgi:hypothetical protein
MAGEWVMVAGMVLTAFLVAMSALTFLAAWLSRTPAPEPSIFDASPDRVAFLFDGERLVDASPAGRALLPEGEESRTFARLVARFGPDFPNLSERLTALPKVGLITIPSHPGVTPALVLKAENVAGLTRLTVDGGQTDPREGAGDAATVAALQHEVMSQRTVLSRAPVLIWKESSEGAVIWANHAYLIRAVELLPEGEDLSWPLPKLFGGRGRQGPTAPAEAADAQRAGVVRPGADAAGG